jgi:hypothetical protein
MEGVYDYYKTVCRCTDSYTPGVGEAETYFDYFCRYCVRDGDRVFLGLRDLDDHEVGRWPVTVYNIDEVAIGYATTKDQYITVWNADPDNQVIGVLSSGNGPFAFVLTLNPGQISPPWVLGEPDIIIKEGIYEEEYAEEYE